MLDLNLFREIKLDANNSIYIGQAPRAFGIQSEQFQTLWSLHPADYHTLMIHGREVKTPRWQQAFGKDYSYTGTTNTALPVPPILQPMQEWCCTAIDARLNGMLLNWYDGASRHYIGAHRDDSRDLQHGSPIVTISFGEERVFRMRPWKKKGFIDAMLHHGDVLVIPFEVNQRWTHEVPHFARYTGKRVSVTLRAYQG